MSQCFFNYVKAFLLKIECVLTDGRSLTFDNGCSSFVLNEKDTFALRMAKLNGYTVGLYSDVFSKEEAVFFTRYGIDESDIFIPSVNRVETIKRFASQHHLTPQCVLYAGCDILDAGCVEMAGVVSSPSDAAPEMKDCSNFLSPYEGGHLFVRDIIGTVMKSHERWVYDPVSYAKLF